MKNADREQKKKIEKRRENLEHSKFFYFLSSFFSLTPRFQLIRSQAIGKAVKREERK
jgi:hypothetical protein